MMNKTFMTSVVVVALALGSMNTAFAAKGGKKANSTGANAEVGATLSSSCDSYCVAGQEIHFHGTGYDAALGALLKVGSGHWSSIQVEHDGTVNFNFINLDFPGDYSFQIYQNGKGNKLEMKSEVIVTIQ